MSNSVEVNGVITEQLPNGMFTVQLEDGRSVKAAISGKLRMNYIRLLVGDRVTVTIDDETRSRITYRFK